MAHQSLAELAVLTLAEIQRLDFDVPADAPERYAVWAMKEAAEQAIEQGLKVALAIARGTKHARDAVAEVQKSK